MATLLQEYANAQDTDLQSKIQMAICNAALSIVGENAGTTPLGQEAKRQQLGVNVLNNPSAWVLQFTIACCTLTGGEISNASTDAQIEVAVSSVWNDIAGSD